MIFFFKDYCSSTFSMNFFLQISLNVLNFSLSIPFDEKRFTSGLSLGLLLDFFSSLDFLKSARLDAPFENSQVVVIGEEQLAEEIFRESAGLKL